MQSTGAVRVRHLAQLSGIDWGLLISALALAVIGLATVHSASAELTVDYLPRQAVWAAVGIVLMIAALSIDYQILLDTSLPLYIFACALLLLVLLFGHEAGGARSWIGIGAFGGQPSEFAKIAVTLFLARYLAKANRKVLSIADIAMACVLVGIPMVLIALEPDLGGAAMHVPMIAGMLLVAGVRLRVLVASLLVVAVLGGAIWAFGIQSYQRDRVMTYLQPGSDPLGKGYQVRQSKIAVGSGELLGKGYMQGTQSQLRFLPARHTDFVFSVLAEEWGFLGVLLTLALFAVYILCGARVAMRARDRGGILIVVGLLGVICCHVVYNSAMVVGMLPITGIPLPFLSYGGSFTLFNFVATGLILGIDVRRYVNR